MSQIEWGLVLVYFMEVQMRMINKKIEMVRGGFIIPHNRMNLFNGDLKLINNFQLSEEDWLEG